MTRCFIDFIKKEIKQRVEIKGRTEETHADLAASQIFQVTKNLSFWCNEGRQARPSWKCFCTKLHSGCLCFGLTLRTSAEVIL